MGSSSGVGACGGHIKWNGGWGEGVTPSGRLLQRLATS